MPVTSAPGHGDRGILPESLLGSQPRPNSDLLLQGGTIKAIRRRAREEDPRCPAQASMCAHTGEYLHASTNATQHITLGVHRHSGSSVLLKSNRDRLVGWGVGTMAFASRFSFWFLSEVEL